MNLKNILPTRIIVYPLFAFSIKPLNFRRVRTATYSLQNSIATGALVYNLNTDHATGINFLPNIHDTKVSKISGHPKWCPKKDGKIPRTGNPPNAAGK
jgi:hypothetical protein